MAWFVSVIAGRRGAVPRELEESGRETWVLQRNYYDVTTLLQAPGRILRMDPAGRVRVLDELSPEQWLRRELEGGTRLQPSRADATD